MSESPQESVPVRERGAPSSPTPAADVPIQRTPASAATLSASSSPNTPGPPVANAKLKTTMEMVTGHWCQPNVGVAIAPSEFYALVTQAVVARNFPGVEFSRVFWKEEAFTGAKREYLRVQRARIVFDICAAPQGAGSFFSSWLCIVPFQISAAHLAGIFTGMIFLFWLVPIALIYGFALMASAGLWWWLSRVATTTSFMDDFLLGLTGVGPIAKFFAELKPTYYQIDAAIIFQSTVQAATLEVIDRLKVSVTGTSMRGPSAGTWE